MNSHILGQSAWTLKKLLGSARGLQKCMPNPHPDGPPASAWCFGKGDHLSYVHYAMKVFFRIVTRSLGSLFTCICAFLWLILYVKKTEQYSKFLSIFFRYNIWFLIYTDSSATSNICVHGNCDTVGPVLPAILHDTTSIDLRDGRVLFVGSNVAGVINQHTW